MLIQEQVIVKDISKKKVQWDSNPQPNKTVDVWASAKLNYLFSREVVEECLLWIYCDDAKAYIVS